MRRLVLALCVLLAACVDADAPVNPGDDTPIELEVPQGANATRLGPQLVELGLAPGEFQWKWFLRGTDGSCVKAGRFELRRSMSMREVLQTLCGPPLPEDVPFTVVEGWRIRDIDAALAEQGWIEAGAYAALAETKQVDLPFPIESPTLEGYLYPETYRLVPSRFDAETFIERQLQTFQERFLAAREAEIAARGLHPVVVMASMLEREEPAPSQRPLVAGILWKRIDNGWALGVDATSRYTLDKWNDRKAFLKKLRDPSDPYNTRLNKGLPPTAIGNPSLPSLEAAIAPVDSEFWYYLHDHGGVLRPSRNAAEHEAKRKQYDVW